MRSSEQLDVVIVGAGLSGTLVAANLLRSGRCVRVALTERSGRFFRGIAFGTGCPGHLLNVPACRMSAFADDADHFVRWLATDDPESGPADFAPREAYGRYLTAVVEEARRAAAPGSRLFLLPENAEFARRSAGGFVVRVGGGTIPARTLVLATGHEPAGARGAGVDPWSDGALSGLDPDAPVLVLGTGLTMADVLIALRANGHRGVVHALSRRGLLPRSHAVFPEQPAPPSPLPRRLRDLVRHIRAEAEIHGARPAVDSLRARTQQMWQGLDPIERARFLRHVRPWWDAYRHRVPSPVAAMLLRELSEGSLVARAARLISAETAGNGVRATIRVRGREETRVLEVARLFDCTGPSVDLRGACAPILERLREAGMLVPDPEGLGLVSDAWGRVLDTQGEAQDDLLAIGPLRKGTLWETTAVPEIRVQAQEVAAQILAAGEAQERSLSPSG